MDKRLLMKSWNTVKNPLDEQDRSKFDRLMLGDEEDSIPWTAGYTLGYYMVSNYMKKFNWSDFNDLLTAAAPETIYQNSSLNWAWKRSLIITLRSNGNIRNAKTATEEVLILSDRFVLFCQLTNHCLCFRAPCFYFQYAILQIGKDYHRRGFFSLLG